MRHVFVAASLLIPSAPTSDPLRLLVEHYLEGQRNEAVASLETLDEASIRAQAKYIFAKLAPDLIRDEPRSASLFKAGVMLLTDRALLERGQGQFDQGWRTLDITGDVVGEVTVTCSHPPIFRTTAYSVRSCTSCLSFARRWFLLSGLVFFGTGELERSRSLFERGLKQFRNDPHLLLALGTLEEKLGSTRIYDPPLGSQGRHSALDQYGRHSALDEYMEPVAARARHLAAAAGYLRKALAAEPQLLEARLRLGHVLSLQGHEDRARAEYEAVEQRAPEAATRYLAALFQGRLHERQRRFPQAAEAYGRATGYLGSSPTAYIALAHAMDGVGNRGGVSDLLDHALQPVDPAAPQDPWWTYLMGQFHEADPLYRALQAEVRP
jgi:tetratricopeptide (TPR) repeat protein